MVGCYAAEEIVLDEPVGSAASMSDPGSLTVRVRISTDNFTPECGVLCHGSGQRFGVLKQVGED